MLFSGFLYGSYRSKRTISMTDSAENEVHIEQRITISHYCLNNNNSSNHVLHPDCEHNLINKFGGKIEVGVCLGMFILKRNENHLYPSFRDIHSLRQIRYSSPVLLLMISVPRIDPLRQSLNWIYSIKHTCFTYDIETSTLKTTPILIPSLAPDLAGEFDGATCLQSSRMILPVSPAYGRGGDDLLYYKQQMNEMTASSVAQVVDTELTTVSLLDAIKVCSYCS
jgi:hypothetical protein